MIAERLLAGQEYLRGDEHLSFMLWRDLSFAADIGLSEAAKFIPIEFADGGDVPEDEVYNLRWTLDNYLMKLSDRLVQSGAREYLAPSGVPLDKYDAIVEIYAVTAKVTYVHRDTDFAFTLHDIFFDDSGKILQAVLSL